MLYFVTEMKLFILMVFGVKHVLQEVKEFNCGYFCIGLIDFMLAGKKLTDYTNYFSAHDFKKNDNIILSYFKNEEK